MNEKGPDRDTTISEILAQTPEATEVFTSLRTHCVGCLLARFCTPREVAAWYRLDLSMVLERLEGATLSRGRRRIP